MAYDNMHNITRKKQHMVQSGLKFGGILHAGYELNYTINAENCQQIRNIADVSYRQASPATAAYQTGIQNGVELKQKTEEYGYDVNGNLLSVLTGTRQGDNLQVTNSRKMLWDEENRLQAVSDNGFVSNYYYDASGERTVKLSGASQGVFVNGALNSATTQTNRFTAYISPYLVLNSGGYYSKHIYAGTQRIVSKLGSSEIFHSAPTFSSLPTGKLTSLTATVKARYDSLGVAYHGSPQGTNGFETSASGKINTPQLYFYHPDHLGSSSLITDNDGLLVQHLQYLPFGEVFIDERKGSWHTPFTFSAKEQDEETGLHYFSARYYDSRTSTWLSVDPLAEKYPNISSYVYCANNPIKYIDPDGKAVFYSRSGVYLGNNGVDDKKVYLMNEGARPRTENDNINWGGKLDKSTSNQLMRASTEVGGLIIQDRVEEGDDYTISEFKTVGGDENVEGFILEPAGPSTKESGKDKRIPEGVYDVESYSSKKYPNNFLLSNKDVPKSRKILYHSGNKGSNTAGCNLPGTTKGKGSIGGSKSKMQEVRDFFNSKGANKVKTIINNKIPNKK